MPGISWLVYHDEAGEIYQCGGLSGTFPEDGSPCDDGGTVRHLMRDDLESLGFQNPAQFMAENHWNGNGWTNRGSKPTPYYRWEERWVLNTNLLLWQIRLDRGLKLLNSDWTQIADSPLSESKKEEWATYRQILRDITENLPGELDDAANVVWPPSPS